MVGGGSDVRRADCRGHRLRKGTRCYAYTCTCCYAYTCTCAIAQHVHIHARVRVNVQGVAVGYLQTTCQIFFALGGLAGTGLAGALPGLGQGQG